MIVVGCDPGLDGGFAVLQDGVMDSLHRMPVVAAGGKRTVDSAGIARLFARVPGATLYLEKVGGRPGQSAHAAFNFGRGVGMIEAHAVAYAMPLYQVPASVWKPRLSCPKDKDAACLFAAEVFPISRNSFLEWGTQVGRSGLAEAALIALYGWRDQQGLSHRTLSTTKEST